MKTQNVQVGTSPCFLLFLVFLVLKLCKVVAWSWMWVTAPLWIPLAIVGAIWFVILIVVGITFLITGKNIL